MKIFIIGGTGFLGFHAIKKLLAQGHQISTLVLPDIQIGKWFPSEVEINYGNVFEMPNSDLFHLFQNFEVLIYAIGPDDRVTPPHPAADFFQKYLVNQSERIANLARESGISTFILLNSYFAYFAKKWPEIPLEKHHPYIFCRVLQAFRVIEAGKDSMRVVVLQLPYIFGTMPERPPIWKDLFVKKLINRKTIWFPDGGSNMIAVDAVAKAIVGAITYGIHGRRYLIGDKNLKWRELFEIMLDELGLNKKIRKLPKWVAKIVGIVLYLRHKKERKESGLNPLFIFDDIEYREMFFDPTPSQKELHFHGKNLEKAIRETVRESMKYINASHESNEKKV